MQTQKIPLALQKILDFFPNTLCACFLSDKKGTIAAHNARFATFFQELGSSFEGKSLSTLLKKFGVKHTDFLLSNPPDGEARTFTVPGRTFICFKKTLLPSDFNLPISEEIYIFFWSEIPYQQGEKYELLLHEFEIILDSIQDGIWIIDGNGITIHANKGLQRIAGINPKEVVGKHVTIPMAEGKFTSCVTLDALKSKKPVTQFDDYATGARCINTSVPILNSKGEVSRVVASIRDLTELEALQEKLVKTELEAMKYKGQLEKLDKGKGYIGSSPAFQTCLKQLNKVAKSLSCVLLLGETGTGKSLAASHIHNSSPRKDKPFIAINCAAIPESLIESELFGYNKGAFTGADQGGKKGYFEQANGGTLLLDEIGELPLSIQAKLLHVLDNFSFHKVGGNTEVKVDVRIIAATNRPLDELVKTGGFRSDLFYRLNVLAVKIPPLRERLDDVPELAVSFLQDACQRLGTSKIFSPKALLVLSGHTWPGNIRELRGAVEYLVAMSEGHSIRVEDLYPHVIPESVEQKKTYSTNSKTLQEVVNELEYNMIKDTLIKEGSTYKAAKVLGTSQSTIVRKAQKLGIRISEHGSLDENK